MYIIYYVVCTRSYILHIIYMWSGYITVSREKILYVRDLIYLWFFLFSQLLITSKCSRSVFEKKIGVFLGGHRMWLQDMLVSNRTATLLNNIPYVILYTRAHTHLWCLHIIFIPLKISHQSTLKESLMVYNKFNVHYIMCRYDCNLQYISYLHHIICLCNRFQRWFTQNVNQLLSKWREINFSKNLKSILYSG